MKTQIQKVAYLIQALLLLVVPVFISSHSYAAEISNRSVSSTSAIPSAQASQTFTFNVINSSTIGSIEFEHCANSPFIGAPCVAPTGFSALAATLSAQSTNTGFTIDIINSSINRTVLTRVAASGIPGATSYTFANIINSSVSNQTTYVRIALFSSTDGTGPRGDSGAVAYATVGAFSVGAYVPPYLIFCAAVTVALDCSSSTGLLISFGELSSSATKAATSQFSGATNDPTGYSVSIAGQTMTAGNQAIPPMSSNAGSSIGSGQFGINLRSNGVPSVGADPTGAGTAAVNAPYNTPNQYRFVNGEQLTNTTLPTDYNLHTVSYIVNISSSQSPGYYATTMTYIATAAF